MRIYQLVPEPDVLLGLATEELGFQLLRVAHANLRNGLVHRDNVISIETRPGDPIVYTHQQRPEVEMALMEALHWLETQGLLIAAPGINGNNGFRVFSRRGREVLDRNRFDDFRRAAAFPKSLLYPAIADVVWLDLARGDFGTAVFRAFRAVEEAVRDACGYQPTDIGAPMMRRAFDPTNGPLTDQAQPLPEREALAHLFAGAIGSYKNPHSHRTVVIADPTEAQEQVILASHLLRIVDARQQNRS